MNSDFKVDSPIPIPTPTTTTTTLKTESTSTKLKTEDLSSPAQNPIKKNDATNMSTSVITLVDDDKQKIKSLEGREYICTNKVLGHGNFSRVYGGYACQYTPVAIKKIAIADYVYTSATNLTVGSNNTTNIVTVYYSVDKIGVEDPDEQGRYIKPG